jgi:hypothetical protein
MTQNGYILIVDITGYTAYLSQTELSHAQEILEALMNSLVDHLHPPIIISRIEGDGIFAYTMDNCFLQGQTLLEALEHLYCSFAFELEHITRNTTCTCQACARLPELGLKMIPHHGEFGIQTVGDRTDLVGTSVNLTHRLAKNSIKEHTDISEYAFFTRDCIEALNLKGFAEKAMVPHKESYEHIGEVEGYAYDLIPVWHRDKERRRVVLAPEEIVAETVMELPVSPPIAWDYMNDPTVRASYLGSDSITTSKVDGRMTVGSQFHCAHGDIVFDQLILDWQPFEYITFEQAIALPGKLRAKMKMMIQLEEIPEGTRVISSYAKPVSTNPLAKLMLRAAGKQMEQMAYDSKDFTERILLEAIEANINPDVPQIKMAVPDDLVERKSI